MNHVNTSTKNSQGLPSNILVEPAPKTKNPVFIKSSDLTLLEDLSSQKQNLPEPDRSHSVPLRDLVNSISELQEIREYCEQCASTAKRIHPFSKQRSRAVYRFTYRVVREFFRHQLIMRRLAERGKYKLYAVRMNDRYNFYIANGKRGFFPCPFKMLKRWNSRYYEILRWYKKIGFYIQDKYPPVPRIHKCGYATLNLKALYEERKRLFYLRKQQQEEKGELNISKKKVYSQTEAAIKKRNYRKLLDETGKISINRCQKIQIKTFSGRSEATHYVSKHNIYKYNNKEAKFGGIESLTPLDIDNAREQIDPNDLFSLDNHIRIDLLEKLSNPFLPYSEKESVFSCVKSVCGLPESLFRYNPETLLTTEGLDLLNFCIYSLEDIDSLSIVFLCGKSLLKTYVAQRLGKVQFLSGKSVRVVNMSWLVWKFLNDHGDWWREFLECDFLVINNCFTFKSLGGFRGSDGEYYYNKLNRQFGLAILYDFLKIRSEYGAITCLVSHKELFDYGKKYNLPLRDLILQNGKVVRLDGYLHCKEEGLFLG